MGRRRNTIGIRWGIRSFGAVGAPQRRPKVGKHGYGLHEIFKVIELHQKEVNKKKGHME